MALESVDVGCDRAHVHGSAGAARKEEKDGEGETDDQAEADADGSVELGLPGAFLKLLGLRAVWKRLAGGRSFAFSGRAINRSLNGGMKMALGFEGVLRDVPL
jgi:hypothetical protein